MQLIGVFFLREEVSKQTKMKVYREIYRLILTYGCESWVLFRIDSNKIGDVEMKYLRKVDGFFRRDGIRNDKG